MTFCQIGSPLTVDFSSFCGISIKRNSLSLNFFLHRVAKEVEKIVKNNGAIPATIAVISGKIHVGGCDPIFHFAFFFLEALLEKNYEISIQSQ